MITRYYFYVFKWLLHQYVHEKLLKGAITHPVREQYYELMLWLYSVHMHNKSIGLRTDWLGYVWVNCECMCVHDKQWWGGPDYVVQPVFMCQTSSHNTLQVTMFVTQAKSYTF